MEEVELSFVPVKISPEDGTLIDHAPVHPEDEIKNDKFYDDLLDENRGEAKSSEASEIIDDAKMQDSIKTYSDINDEISDAINDAKIDSVKTSTRTNDEVIPVDVLPLQSDHVIDDGKRSENRGVVQSSGLEGENSGAMSQRSQAMTGSLVEEMRQECESIPVKKQGLAHIEVISTDCVPIQSDVPVCPSHIVGEDLGDANQSDAMIISFGEEMGIQSKLTRQELVEADTKTREVIGASLKDAKSSSADKLSQNSEIGKS